MSLLEIEDLTVTADRGDRPIVSGVSLSLESGECLGLVGESGSGKSTVCRAALGILAPSLHAKGRVLLRGEDLLRVSARRMQQIRGKELYMIMQDAMSAFHPGYPMGKQIRTILSSHMEVPKGDDSLILEALRKMQLRSPEELLKKYPHQLSGGMLQRVMIGIGLMLRPQIILADEPTTALDSVTQREIISQLSDLLRGEGLTMIFVSNDLGVVRRVADRVAVMKDGQVVETGDAGRVFSDPQNDYTRYLVESRRMLSSTFLEVIGA